MIKKIWNNQQYIKCLFIDYNFKYLLNLKWNEHDANKKVFNYKWLIKIILCNNDFNLSI